VPAVVRVLLTLLLALAAALLCVALHTPIPWMIGPLVATALLSMAGVPTASATPLRNAAQWTIGTALGLYFTPAITALVAGMWWAILLAIAWSLALGTLFGAWLQRVHAPRFAQFGAGQLRATTYFSGAIGAASEMTLLAERAGARTDLVAASHSLRMVIVTLLVPFAMQWSGLHGLDMLPPAVRDVRLPGLALLAVATGAGVLLLRRAGGTNPWFLGALVVSMGITMSGTVLSAVPAWLTSAAQLLLGVSLGVRFTREFVHTAPRWLGSIAIGTLGLLALSAGFAVLLSQATGLHWATMVLGTSPGGITEMSITAKVLQLGVPVVTAFQVCRLIAVLLLVEPAYRRFFGAGKHNATA